MHSFGQEKAIEEGSPCSLEPLPVIIRPVLAIPALLWTIFPAFTANTHGLYNQGSRPLVSV